MTLEFQTPHVFPPLFKWMKPASPQAALQEFLILMDSPLYPTAKTAWFKADSQSEKTF